LVRLVIFIYDARSHTHQIRSQLTLSQQSEGSNGKGTR